MCRLYSSIWLGKVRFTYPTASDRYMFCSLITWAPRLARPMGRGNRTHIQLTKCAASSHDRPDPARSDSSTVAIGSFLARRIQWYQDWPIWRAEDTVRTTSRPRERRHRPIAWIPLTLLPSRSHSVHVMRAAKVGSRTWASGAPRKQNAQGVEGRCGVFTQSPGSATLCFLDAYDQ